jgi:predicted DNA-binding protein (UPF0251 family)
MQARDIVILLSERLRLVRSEYNLTQERMAEILGLSKKTLEKPPVLARSGHFGHKFF